MTTLDLQTTVAEWVTRHPRTSRVFETLQIDYCCGGRHSLDDACHSKKLDPDDVMRQLMETVAEVDPFRIDWQYFTLTELCHHIERTHHVYLRRELPRLSEMIAKVEAAHGCRYPALRQVQQIFMLLRAELEPHLLKEEGILFPAIRQLERSEASPGFAFGTVANPIRAMVHEHDEAGQAIAQIRHITGNFAVPSDACTTYRALLDGLRELEQDLHQHVHKENNILFPRAIELEKMRSNATL